MFVELVDLLRCPHPHEDSWLVLAARRTVDRHVLEGMLGCPVCAREYTVLEGVADLRVDATVAVPPAERVPASDELAVMIAAFAGLTEPGGTVLLGGGLAHVADALARLTSVAPLVVNPPPGHDPMVSALRCASRLPLAPNGVRAMVLDRGMAAALDLEVATRSVRPGGRIVAPASVPLPAGARELARDDAWWVAEREPPRVTLRRA